MHTRHNARASPPTHSRNQQPHRDRLLMIRASVRITSAHRSANPIHSMPQPLGASAHEALTAPRSASNDALTAVSPFTSEAALRPPAELRSERPTPHRDQDLRTKACHGRGPGEARRTSPTPRAVPVERHIGDAASRADTQRVCDYTLTSL
jgi:hypothetical protein